MTAPDDRAAITSLLLDYGRLCDEGRFAELSLLFTDEAELWIGDEPAHGRAAVRDAIATRQTPDRRGRHTLAITDVRVDGDTARVESDYVFSRRDVDGALTPRVVGTYLDELVRMAGTGWRFARRRIVLRPLAAPPPEHRPDAGAAAPTGTIEYRVAGAAARVTIRRPGKHNALTAAAMRELVGAIERAAGDDDVKAIVLSGEGPDFCAGFDIADPRAFEGDAGASRRERIDDVREKASWMERILTSRTPVIAAVHGSCIGIGTYLALVADFVVAADDAAFGLPEERLGSAGATWAYPFLVLDVGLKRATEMVMTGRRYDADEALRMGLVTRVVPRGELESTVDDLAGALASLPRDGIAVSRALREVALHHAGYLGTFALHAVAHPLAERIDREDDEFDFMSAVQRDGMRAALAQRNERFGGRWWGW